MKGKQFTKSISLLLTGVMAVSMLAGCGGTDNTEASGDNTSKSSSSASSSSASKESGAFKDYSNGFDEKVTIEIPVYDRAFEGWNVTDNYYTQWIQKEFGDKYNVEVKYVAIGRTTEVQDYMQMIAAGKAPDIIMHYDMPQAVKYYTEGAIQDLDMNEIEFYAPDYYKQLSDTIDIYGELDGKKAFFFGGREAIYYNFVHLIRQDWLDKVNMDMPTNLEELNAVLKAWKDAELGNASTTLIQKSFNYFYPYMNDDISEEEKAQYLDLNVAPFTWKPTEDYLREMNKEYNDGLLDSEFYLNKEDADFKADFVSGKSGIYGFYINSSTDAISSLLANDSDAKVAAMNPAAFSPSGKGYYYENPPYGMIMGINSKTSDEERAAVWMFLDWMIQPENLFYLQNGVEGENYNLDDLGIAVPVEGYDGESKLSQNNNKDYWCMVQEVASYGDEEKNYQANLRMLAPAGYEYLIEDAYNYAKENENYGVLTPIFTKPVEAADEYTADLNAMWQESYVDLITGSVEDFDKKYKEYCEEYLDAGYQDILDEKKELYDNGDYIKD